MPAKPTTPPPPRMPPPQYVLKKDFEPKMQELEGRIRSAINAGASARNTATEVADSMNQISVKVQDIETLLNSANFKIALNSDSLKTTPNRIDELRSELDKSNQALKAEADKASMLIYILFGLAVVFPIIVLVMAMNMNKKLSSEIRNHAERVNSDVQKNYISQQDEMKKIKANLEGEVYNAKADMNLHLSREKDATAAQFKKLLASIDQKMDKEPETPQES
jgi:hypothetical protein